jgi:hypothetical protein
LLLLGQILRPGVNARLAWRQNSQGAEQHHAYAAAAAREGLIDANPAAFTNKRNETRRDRVLSDAEICAIWAALQADDFGDIVKLLLLTGNAGPKLPI